MPGIEVIASEAGDVAATKRLVENAIRPTALGKKNWPECR
jgi:hypothetical protein